MKTAQDPRHKHRIEKMQYLFSQSFPPQVEEANDSIKPILASLPRIDQTIQESAPQWPLDKIAKIDLAILRLAAYELLVESKEPPKVVIDEAIELAKEFGNPNSAKFINGVLGALLKQKDRGTL